MSYECNHHHHHHRIISDVDELPLGHEMRSSERVVQIFVTLDHLGSEREIDEPFGPCFSSLAANTVFFSHLLVKSVT